VVYYSGRAYRHPVDKQEREPNHGAIGLAKLRLDGFVSMDSDSNGGTLTTKPFRVSEAGLYVNADASKGELRVAIADASGAPIQGFTAKDCVPLERDTVRQRMVWEECRPCSFTWQNRSTNVSTEERIALFVRLRRNI